MEKLLEVPNKDIAFKYEDKIWQSSWERDCEGNRIWNFTFRGEEEIRKLHPSIIEIPLPYDLSNTELDNEREIFGETLDEEIPDDLWEMINGI